MSDFVRVLVDDVRSFRDDRACHIVRTAIGAIELLRQLELDGIIDELWLDYDLGGGSTILPVVSWLVEASAQVDPLPVRRIRVHSSNVVGAFKITGMLRAAGYQVEREYNRMLWTRQSLPRGES